jgi:hypothetical protein
MSLEAWGDEGPDGPELPEGWLDEEQAAALEARIKRLESALRGIIEIGKRDLTNPKYDAFFDEARAVLKEEADG